MAVSTGVLHAIKRSTTRPMRTVDHQLDRLKISAPIPWRLRSYPGTGGALTNERCRY